MRTPSRLLVLAAPLALLAIGAGCGNIRACKNGTALITVDFASAASADMVLVSASIDGGDVVSGTYAHHAGDSSGTIELDFGSYPTGHTLDITVSALSGSLIIATNTATVTLASGCTPITLSLADGSGNADFAGTDGGPGMVRHPGDSCTPADQCVGSTCVDGFCCNTACTDTCAACDVPGMEGTCSPVNGAPHGGRACMGSATGACAGTCNGIDTGICNYSTGACGAAPSCTAGVATAAGSCSMGTCSQPMMSCPDKLCGATACDGILQVAVGSDFVCTLISDGTVRCWGHNNYGQLGQGGTDTTDRHVPTTVPGLTGVTAIGAGDEHACAVLAGGALKCWGANYSGQLGHGDSGDNTAHPTPSAVCNTGTGASCVALTGVSAVAGSLDNTCAIVGTGVKCWGNDPDGNLGNGPPPSVNPPFNPVQVCAGPTACTNPLGYVNGGIVEIAMGVYHVCARDGNNNVFCWGNNGAGETGATNNGGVNGYPQNITGLTNGAQKPIGLSATAYGACALLSDGTTANNIVRCWGYGADGELGNSTSGSNAYGPTPVNVCASAGCGSTLTGASKITGSYAANCAVVAGAIWCWGENAVGEGALGATTPANNTVATKSLLATGVIDVASECDGYTYCAKLNAGGLMRCWGKNAEGEVGNNTVVTPVTTPVAQSW